MLLEPPKKLITISLYKIVRNPVYISHFLILLGEFLLFGEILLLGYLMLYVIGIHAYLVLFEEKGLEKRFGKEWLEYKTRVLRWIPRV